MKNNWKPIPETLRKRLDEDIRLGGRGFIEYNEMGEPRRIDPVQLTMYVDKTFKAKLSVEIDEFFAVLKNSGLTPKASDIMDILAHHKIL